MPTVPLHLQPLTPAQQQGLHTWLEQFARSWTDQALAAWVKQLPPAGQPFRLAALVELVKVDLDKQWERGRRSVLEAYLKFYPELGTPQDVSRALIEAECHLRQKHLGTVDWAAMARRFPQRQSDLHSLAVQFSGPVDSAADQLSGSMLESESSPQPTLSDLAPPPPPPPKKSPSLPPQFGRYRILKELGKGGMGRVYLAHDTQLDRQVALKVPHFGPNDDADVLHRFLREARAAATLQHPNICPVHDVGEWQGTHYLTMAYIEGQTLAEKLRSAKSLPRPAAVGLIHKLALALQEAHDRKVIHRDLKPSNIMINQRGEPVVMDFGLARRTHTGDEPLTQAGSVLGTPAYMSPEQVRGDLHLMGPGCDIYALGVLLFELLTGRLPFEGKSLALLNMILHQAPDRPRAFRPDLDPRLEAICLKALAKEPEQRFATMREFAAALGPFLGPALQDPGPPSGPTAPLPPAAPRMAQPVSVGTAPLPMAAAAAVAVPVSTHNKKLVLAIGGGVGGLVLVVVLFFMLRSSGPSPAEARRQAGILATKGKEAVEANQPDAALIHLSESVKLDPALAEAYFWRGRAHALKKDHVAADADFTQAIDRKVEQSTVHLYRARARSQAGDFSAAIDDYTKAIAQDVSNAMLHAYKAEAHFEHARIQDDTNEFQEAITEANRALRLDDKLAAAYAFRGLTQTILGDQGQAQARQDAEKALALQPNLPLGLALTARIENALKLYPLALAWSEQALAADKELLHGLVIRGQVYYNLGEAEKGATECTEALRLAPKFVHALVLRGDCRRLTRQFDLAIKDYDAALELAPKCVNAFFGRAFAHDNLRKYDKAVADYTQAIENNRNPQAFDLFCLRGFSRTRMKDFANAKLDFDRSLKINPNYAEGFNGLANLAQAQRQYDEAQIWYDKALELRPAEPIYWSNRGFFYYEQLKDDLAIADFQHALKIKPKHAPALSGLGQAFTAKQELDKAIGYLDQAILLEPRMGSHYQHRAAARVFKRDFVKGFEDFTKALELDPGNAATYNARGLIFLNFQADADKAIQDFTKALEVSPGFSLAQLNRGQAYLRLRNFTQAIADLTKVITSDPPAAPPTVAQAYSHRANAYAQQKDFARAFVDHSEALRLMPKDAIVYDQRGRTLSLQGEHEKALEDFNKATQFNPKYADGFAHRGECLLKLGKAKEALPDFTKATQLDSHYSEAYNGLGLANLELKNYDAAQDAFTRATLINSRYADGYFNLGRTHAAKNNHALAVQDFLKAVQIHDALPEYHRALAAAYSQIGDEALAQEHRTKAMQLEKR